jgi:hypothetical protein
MKKICIVLSTFLLTLGAIAQSEISGVTPAKSITIGKQSINLNGAGLREKMFLDLYVGALYLETKTNDPKAVINTDESMAITLDIVSTLITSGKMISAIDEGFENSTNGNTTPIEEKIQQFKDAFKEEIVKGDRYVIAYTKASGTTVSKNGKVVKTIEGFEFKKALFGIWFCDEPADEDLMEGMLGLD